MEDDLLNSVSSSCSSFRLEEIKQEVLKLREALAIRKDQWEKECSVYDTSSTTKAGRRNQSNFFNRLQDVTLFPYSDKLYAFVCTYDGGIIRDGIIHSGDVFQYFDENDDGDDYDDPLPITDEFLPCNDDDIIQYLIPTPPFHRHCSTCASTRAATINGTGTKMTERLIIVVYGTFNMQTILNTITFKSGHWTMMNQIYTRKYTHP